MSQLAANFDFGPDFGETLTPLSRVFDYGPDAATPLNPGAKFRDALSPDFTAIGSVPAAIFEDTDTRFEAQVGLPFVSAVRPLSPGVVEVTFSRPMRNTPELTSPAKYAFAGGLSAVSVRRVAVDRVEVSVTPPMAVDALFTLTVSP